MNELGWLKNGSLEALRSETPAVDIGGAATFDGTLFRNVGFCLDGVERSGDGVVIPVTATGDVTTAGGEALMRDGEG